MNDIDEMHDDMLRVVRDSLSEVPMSDPPCLEAIVAPARARRRRRHALISRQVPRSRLSSWLPRLAR